MTWHDPPYSGQTYRKRINGKQETRHVIDRTGCGDVCYYYGAFRNHWEARCTEAEWHSWAKGAVLVSR